jgi:hypothetical protein
MRAELKAAKTRRRELISAAREQARPELEAAAAAEKAAVKALYAAYCQQGKPCRRDDGDDAVVLLYWPVYNDVVAHHRIAVSRVMAARAAGHPAQLRHHRWDGGGSLHAQLMHASGDPAAAPEVLASGEGKWRNVLQVHPGDSNARGHRRGRGWARMRIGSSVVNIPIRAHRELPEGADVSGARLVARRTGSVTRASVQLTARVPDPAPRDPTGRPVFAVHLGWRREPDGSVRVATWRATMPVTVPRTGKLTAVLRQDTDRTGTVVLPPSWLSRLAHADKRRGLRDVKLNRIRDKLVAHLRAAAPQEADGWPTAGEVAKWRSPARFATLALRHRDHPPAGREEIVAALEGWRRQDKKWWNAEAHGRRKVIGRRNDAYAEVAAWIVSLAGRVVLDDTVVSELARRSLPGPDAPITALEETASSQRFAAAPGSLRERVRATCAREGVGCETVPCAGITRTHYRCGHVNPADHDYTHRWVECLGCGRDYDQDRSATLVVLAASGDVPPPGQGGARDTG